MHLAAAGLACAHATTPTDNHGGRDGRGGGVAGGYRHGPCALADSGVAVQRRVHKIYLRGWTCGERRELHGAERERRERERERESCYLYIILMVTSLRDVCAYHIPTEPPQPAAATRAIIKLASLCSAARRARVDTLRTVRRTVWHMASSSARSRKVQCNQRAASRSAHGCGRRTHRQSCAGVRAMPSGLHAGRAHLGRSGRCARRCGIGDRWRGSEARFLGPALHLRLQEVVLRFIPN